jgi:hypothetical protein
MYVSSLVPNTQQSVNLLGPLGQMGEGSTSRTELSNGPPPATLNDMVLVRVVGRLFEKTDDDLQKEVNSIKRICTEKVSCSSCSSHFA